MRSVLEALSPEARGLVRKKAQPRWIAPMLAAQMGKRAFSDPRWIFERKFDGVRCLAFRDGSAVRLMSRNEKSLDRAFPEIHEALSQQRHDDFVLDGEIVAFDGPMTSFGLLQKRLGITDPARARQRNVPVVLYLFDVLHADGCDVTAVPLGQRKELLRRIIEFRSGDRAGKDMLRYSDHRHEHGEAYLREACRDGWEGLIAKRFDAPYRSGRSHDWLKLKCTVEQEFVVGGYTEPQSSRVGFGALLVGYYDEHGELHYAGKVGTGFDDETLRILSAHMKKIESRDSPFMDRELLRDRGVRGAHWIRPNLVAQVGFAEWTTDGRLRHPRFLGLRHDKPAAEVVREMRHD